MKGLIDELQHLVTTQEQWVKVHAAEYLVWLGYSTNLKSLFLEEEIQYGQIPKYRIGIWRVLAQADASIDGRAAWLGKILSVFHDTSAPDRLHAIESLAKLKVAVPYTQNVLQKNLFDSPLDSFDLYTIWNAAYHPQIGEVAVRSSVLELLEYAYTTGQNTALLVNAYILRYLGCMQIHDWERLRQLAMDYEGDSTIHAVLLATVWIIAGNGSAIADEVAYLKSALSQLSYDLGALPHLLAALAVRGGRDELPLAINLYVESGNRQGKDYNPDIHAAATYALHCLRKRLCL